MFQSFFHAFRSWYRRDPVGVIAVAVLLTLLILAGLCSIGMREGL